MLARTVLAAACLMFSVSFVLPYWEVVLATAAPRDELRLVAYISKLYNLDGRVPPILAIGGTESNSMTQKSGKLERSLTAASVTVVSLLLLAVLFARNRWATLLSLPAVFFPLIVIADTSDWLRSIVAGISATLGWNHDPSTLPLFGRLAFEGGLLDIRPGAGLILASAGSMAVIAGLWFHREVWLAPAASEAEVRPEEPSRPGVVARRRGEK